MLCICSLNVNPNQNNVCMEIGKYLQVLEICEVCLLMIIWPLYVAAEL